MSKIIFTDFFDTVMFRRVHSYQIYGQWAKMILHRFPVLDGVVSLKDLEGLLHYHRNVLREKYEEPPYHLVIGAVYDKLNEICQFPCSRYEFINYSLEADIAVELGCQYQNRSLIKKFRHLKKTGAQIYIVSDFYLPEEAYSFFLSKEGLSDLFDGIFVSESHNCTKANGTLYDYVLKYLNVSPSDVIMYGDSRHSDVKMSRSRGISGKLYFPFLHKLTTNISLMLNLDYSKSIQSSLSDWLYKNSLFEEYSLIFYHFNQKLKDIALDLGARKLSFLSRGGYFLNKIFHELQSLINSDVLEGLYCYNSRKVCFRARDEKETNGEQYILMKEYMDAFLSEDQKSIYMVDEGWYNHSQQAMCNTFGYDIYGLYIGSRAKEPWHESNICYREGLLFDYRAPNDTSRYYGIFCTNCSMYEQLLTAEHGSVTGYKRCDNGEIVPVFKSNEKEVAIYNMYIRDMQERMKLIIKGLAAWKLGEKLSERSLAKMILRTTIFADHKRCQFLNDLDSHRFDNCSLGQCDTDKSFKDVKINIFRLIAHPDEYLGMFCKLQRKLDNNIITRYAYYPLGAFFYAYTYLFTFVLRRS